MQETKHNYTHKTPAHTHALIETICKEVYEEVRSIAQGKIVNETLSFPIIGAISESDAKQKYRQKQAAHLARQSSPKVLAARNWITLLLACIFLVELLRKEQRSLIWLLLLVVSIKASKFHHQTFNTLPLESIGTDYLLSKDVAKEVELNRKFDEYLAKTQPAKGSLFFFTDKESETAKQDGQIPESEHDAITRALHGVKNGFFDCVSISALVILKLIEKKIPVKIERFHQRGRNTDMPHSFVVVDDFFIIDPWHCIFTTREKIERDPHFFLKYPLMNITRQTGKVVEVKADSKGYQDYLKLLENYLESSEQYRSRLKIRIE